ncbi:hypothetical protein PS906_04137 [Pseudomonas fluorescens]|nr:hypothetical protein PS906_04137 [Pseudomonas fluorescens]
MRRGVSGSVDQHQKGVATGPASSLASQLPQCFMVRPISLWVATGPALSLASRLPQCFMVRPISLWELACQR